MPNPSNFSHMLVVTLHRFKGLIGIFYLSTVCCDIKFQVSPQLINVVTCLLSINPFHFKWCVGALFKIKFNKTSIIDNMVWRLSSLTSAHALPHQPLITFQFHFCRHDLVHSVHCKNSITFGLFESIIMLGRELIFINHL